MPEQSHALDPARRSGVKLLEPLPSRVGVGGGSAVFLHGLCEGTGRRLRSVEVLRHDTDAPIEARVAGSEWWAIVPLEPVSLEAPLTLSVEGAFAGGEGVTATVGTIEMAPGGPDHQRPPPAPHSWPEGPAGRVAICMGTYEPPIELFERQISSIREQSHRGWVCLISDDGSSDAKLAAIEQVLGGDARFRLDPNRSRLGFYANFERALGLAPADATHIALCDQDDRWYPERLETLLAALGEDETLAYSDMRIVDVDGELISDTYWRHRRNNWTDLGTLLIGNTVTGAASLFRRSVLDRALPFPPPVGRAFHDHWRALVSLASGPLRYVDRPLHDYVQHEDAVIGFASANADRGAGSGLTAARRRGLRLAGRAARPDARRRYFADYCRIALLATVLEMRCGELMSPEQRAAVARVRSLDDSLRAAGGFALRSIGSGNETMGVDRSVVAGLLWSRLAGARSKRGSRLRS